MSYILDALKKAEQERGLARVPTLSTVHAPRLWVLGRNHVWLIGVGLALCAAAALWVFLPALIEIVRPAALPGSSRPPVTRATPTLDAPAGQAPSPGPATPPVISAPPATVPRPEIAAPRAAAPPEPRAVFPPFSKADRRFESPASESRQEPARVGPTELAPPALRPAFPNPPAAESAPAAPAPSAAVGAPQIPGLLVPGRPVPVPPIPPAPPAPAPAAVSPVPASPPAQPTPAAASPASLQDALARMTLDMLVYTDVEADRMVTINGRKYVKGDAVEGRYLVEEITREGVTLSYHGEKAVIRP